MSGPLDTENYRGARVPRTLGLLLVATAAMATLVAAVATRVGAPAWGSLAGLGLVFAAGLVDDVVASETRGLRNHLRALAAGHATTGIIKLVVTIGASAVVVALQPARSTPVALAGVMLLAASANVWNGLDVRPGRALKAFVPVATPFVLLGDLALAPAIPGLVLGALVSLPLDLRERAMLGDAGANLLGFGAGLGLYLALPGWGVAAATAAAVALNLLAETFTLSRAIDSVAPLRWLDRLGRRREPSA